MASEDLVPLKLRLTEKSVLNVLSYLYYRDLQVEERERGEYICRVWVENSIELFLRLVQCGTSVEVLEPEWYRRMVGQKLEELAAMYHGERRE
jgi:hypothetical protein